MQTFHITRVLIVGAGHAGVVLARRYLLNGLYGYQVVGFLDDDATKWDRLILGRPVLGSCANVENAVRKLSVDLIAIAMPSADPQRIATIKALCERAQVHVEEFQGLLNAPDHETAVSQMSALGQEVRS